MKLLLSFLHWKCERQHHRESLDDRQTTLDKHNTKESEGRGGGMKCARVITHSQWQIANKRKRGITSKWMRDQKVPTSVWQKRDRQETETWWKHIDWRGCQQENKKKTEEMKVESMLNSSIMYKHALQQRTGHARTASREEKRNRKKRETISTSVSSSLLHPFLFFTS